MAPPSSPAVDSGRYCRTPAPQIVNMAAGAECGIFPSWSLRFTCVVGGNAQNSPDLAWQKNAKRTETKQQIQDHCLCLSITGLSLWVSFQVKIMWCPTCPSFIVWFNQGLTLGNLVDQESQWVELYSRNPEMFNSLIGWCNPTMVQPS